MNKGTRIKNIGFLYLGGFVILMLIFTTWELALLSGIICFSVGLLIKYGIRDKKEVDDD